MVQKYGKVLNYQNNSVYLHAINCYYTFLSMRKIAIGAALLLTMNLQAQNFETATQAISNMGVGWNLGNTLDAHNGQRMTDVVKSETTWGQPVTQRSLMEMLRQAGFGAVRVPVTWYPHMDSNGRVDAQWMKRVREVVDYVVGSGLYCILNVHHDTGADSDTHQSWLKANGTTYAQQRSRYEGLWKQIAEEFRDYDQHLLFESYNEMLDRYNSWCFASYASPARYVAADAADAYQAINNYAQSFVDVVRATGGNNAQRNLVVNTYGACSGAGTWNAHLKEPLQQMKLPADNVKGHLAFQVHSYPNVRNLASMRTEMADMFSALKTHLADKGAPVIIGEWGTANDGENDYVVRRQNVLSFADYFVSQAKAYGFATFWWMGISDGSSRSIPVFTQPDLAQAILQAWYGSDYKPVLPTVDDYDMTYTVNYTGQWQELNLCNFEFSLSDYKAIRLELGQLPKSGCLSIKVYGESDGKEQYSNLPQALSTTLTLNRSTLGSKVRRITLQYGQTANYSIEVKGATLIKTDGTEVATAVTPFWGCTIDVHATKKATDIDFVAAPDQEKSINASGDDNVYNLSGQRVATPLHPGVYISRGRKFVVK